MRRPLIPPAATLLALLATLHAADAGAAGGARPLRTAPAETTGLRALILEAGVDYESGTVPAPLLDPHRTGDLLQAPVVGLRIGLADTVDLEIHGTLYKSFQDSGESDEESVGDFRILTRYARPVGSSGVWATGFRVGLKLPNAPRYKGLGTDQTDVLGSWLLTARTRTAELHFNLGIAILGDPDPAGNQDDAVLYGVAFEVPLPKSRRTRLLGEVSGTWDIAGYDSTTSNFLLGFDHTLQRLRVDAALTAGLGGYSGDWGATAGVSWRFGPQSAAPSP